MNTLTFALCLLFYGAVVFYIYYDTTNHKEK
jgi:hypothetical protein